MIDFMIIGLPRSGTTWAANLFCTGDLLCIHDPLYRYHFSDWDRLQAPGKRIGISCTGIWQWPEWLSKHPAKKVILHRPIGEVNDSLAAIGFPLCDADGPQKLDQVAGLHVPHTDLFDQKKAAAIWRHLVGGQLDTARHAELVQIEMQPNFMGLTVGKEVTRRLLDDIRGALA